MTGTIAIRRERPQDRAGIRSVHRAAFARPGYVGDQVREAVLVDELREGPWWLPRLSLVAVSGKVLVGHVVASRATVQPSGAAVLGLGPIGVEPDWQRQGVGSTLMHAVLAAAEARDEAVVVVLGDPVYYRRFGFVPAAEHGLLPPDPAWGAAFQLRALSGPVPHGVVRYAAPFDAVG